ncbi:MAG: NAD-dependent epimerase/dehydratase family protein [Proteobacteria bacterium]|nr:NAD-dependent epimerase/dehydratase family protein [Pseudomonadota bacterium]MDA1356460.1 NAD-dependent epimerase/dehydratase family protein [Pseudomonadota bacterium]
MKVVITGGTGFLGLRLARAILERGTLRGASGAPEPVDEMILFDAVTPAERPEGLDARVKIVSGDISDRDLVMRLIAGNSLSIFHFASVVSAGAEQDFDLALKVNLDGGLNVLEAARAAPGLPRVVFTSSLAVFGGSALPDTVSDDTKITPMTTYGMTKAINELLLNDYTRKGFLDGRGARLPTVIIRPGKPNKAASGFASGVFREPLSGTDYELPVSNETRMAVSGYRTIVEGILALHEADSDAVGDDRSINLPSVSLTVTEMIEGLRRVAGNRPLGQIIAKPDPAIQEICNGWPGRELAPRASALGLPADKDLDSIIRAYIEDYADA